MRKFIFALSALVVVAAIGVILYVRFFTKAEPQLTVPLEACVPARLEGWNVEELPLAETEGMRDYIGEFLQFDQYISRVYAKGALRIVFYVAYWEPGGKSPFDAGGHNPDYCWV